MLYAAPAYEHGKGKDLMKTVMSLGIGWIVVVLALMVGWVMNIVTLVQHANDPVTTMTVLRAVGIFIAPLGGVLGYI